MQAATTSSAPQQLQPQRLCSAAEDIGVAGKTLSTLSNAEKVLLLTNPWKPSKDNNFSYPYSERTDRGKKIKLHLSARHVTGEYEDFNYSRTYGGLMCTPCVLFGPREVRGVALKALVDTPFSNYSKLTGKTGYLTEHLRKSYHADAKFKAAEFLKTALNNSDVSRLVNNAYSKEVDENRIRLMRIIVALEHHGRLGAPLRGHRDSGPINLTDDIVYDQGQFRATLQLMVECGDHELRAHLEKHAGGRGHYISPSSQNELIECIDKVMMLEIVNKVNSAKFYSIIADETTDCSGQEQLSLCVRFMDSKFHIQERFLKFEIVKDLSGKALANTILSILENAHLSIQNIVGQGYDGAAAMSGNQSGVQKFISDKVPMATYVHCVSHSLNLCLEKASNIPEIQACLTTMKEIIVFFRESPKRTNYLKSVVDEIYEDSNEDIESLPRKKLRLKKMCPTRWVESQESTEMFVAMYDAIRKACDRLSSGDLGPIVAGKCLSFTKQITSSSFLISMKTLSLCLSTTRSLSVALQLSDIDAYQAMMSIASCEKTIQNYRNDESFTALYNDAELLLGDAPLTRPRVVSRMTKRANPPSDSPFQYFCIAIFLPYLDTVLLQINERFSKHKLIWQGLFSLIPAVIQQGEIVHDNITNLLDTYANIIPGTTEELLAEFKRWESL